MKLIASTLILFTMAGLAAGTEASLEEAAGADLIVAKCGNVAPSKRDTCVTDMLDQFSPEVMHRARYFADVRMRATDQARNDEACKKAKLERGSVKLGMTQAQVRQCGWGEPSDVNRTTDKYGVHEQWVYGSGNYLYFQNGRLTTIQN